MSEIRVGKSASPDEAGRIAERRKLAKDQERIDLEAALRHPEIRRYLWNIIMATGALGGSTPTLSPQELAFCEGRRSVGASIYEDILAVDPAALMEGIRREADRRIAKSGKEQ